MTLWAMCFVFLPLSCDSASCVLCISDRLQMIRIDATRNPAKMVKLQSGRYWANEQFVGNAMRPLHVGVGERAGLNLSVAAILEHASPQPTATIRLWSLSIGGSHVTPYRSHRSGLHEAMNFVAARFYFTQSRIDYAWRGKPCSEKIKAAI